MPAHVTYVDGKCTCCPYGYHVDLDFLNFCDDLEAGSTLRNLKRIQRTKRNLRKSMEIMLSSQEGQAGDPNSSSPEDMASSDAERLLHMINYEQSASHNILRHIDTSVTAMASYREGGGDWRHLPHDSDKAHTVVHVTHNHHEDPRQKSWPTLARGDSITSLSSESTMSGEAGLLHQGEFVQEQQRVYRATKTTTKLVENPVLEMATAEMKHYCTTSSAQLLDDDGDPVDMSTPLDVTRPLERQVLFKSSATAAINPTRPVISIARPVPDVDETSAQLMRDSTAVSLQRIKVLEQQVKTIPILQVRISVLKEEKRLLNMQLKASKPSTRFHTSSDVKEVKEHSTHSSRSSPLKPVITSSIGVGDHSIIEPYKLQPHLPTGYTIQDNETTFEIHSRAFLEDERLAVSESLKRSFLQESRHETSKWANAPQQTIPGLTQASLRVDHIQQSSPRPMTRSVGVGEGNVNLQVHDKEVRTLILGAGNSGPAKRNVGVECRVPTRDVGVSFRCDDVKPETRTVGVNVSYDTSGILTSLDFKGETELRMAIQGVLHRSVRSVGTNCILKQTTADNGTMTDLDAGVSVGCGDEDHNVDVEVRPVTVRKSVAVVAKPEVGNKYVSTEADWIQDVGTNTSQANLYDKAVMTEKQKQSFVSTNTEVIITHPTSMQTEQTVFLSMEQVKHASSNTDTASRYSTGVSTDIIPTHNAGTNTVEKVSDLFQETFNHRSSSSLDRQSSQGTADTHRRDVSGDRADTIDFMTKTSDVTTWGQASEKSSDRDSSILSKSESSKTSSQFDDGNKHYSSLKVFSQGQVGGQVSKTSSQVSKTSSQVSKTSREEDITQRSKTSTQDDISTRQSVSQNVAPSSPESKFSETVVEHFLLTKDGSKKLISEETITTSSTGTNRTFKQYMAGDNQSGESAASIHPGTFSGSRTVGDTGSGGWGSTSSSGSYSFHTDTDSNAVHSFPTSRSTSEELSAEASHALESGSVGSSSGVYNFSRKLNEDVHKDSRQKIDRAGGVTSTETMWDMRRAGSVEDFMPNDIRKYMSIDPSTPTSSVLIADLFRKSSEELSRTSAPWITGATTSGSGEVSSFTMSQTSSTTKSEDTGLEQKMQAWRDSGNQLINVAELMESGETGSWGSRHSGNRLHLSDNDASVFSSSSSSTYSSSQGGSSIGHISSSTTENVSAGGSIMGSGEDSLRELEATNETGGRRGLMGEGESHDASLSRRATQLKSIMKHKTETQSAGGKKGITFAESVTGGYELPEEVRKACLVLATYLTDSTTIQTKQLNHSQEIVRQEWFQLSSHKLSSVDHVNIFLSSIKDISTRLMEYILNLTDANGNTAIHYCISHCNFEIAIVLLDSKVCDINKRNKAGFTPIMLAGLVMVQDQQNWDLVRKVLSFGDINAKATGTQQTALMLAASHGRTEMVKLLVEMGANLNLQDEDGSTALMCACEHGHLDIVNFLLLQPGIDVNVTDSEGSTALNISMEADHKDIGVVLYKYLNFSKAPFPGSYKKRKGSSSPT